MTDKLRWHPKPDDWHYEPEAFKKMLAEVEAIAQEDEERHQAIVRDDQLLPVGGENK